MTWAKTTRCGVCYMSEATSRHTQNEILKVSNLKKHFPIERGLLRKVQGYVKAVDDVSFNVYEGETLGLVGESGCGKTTTGRAIMRAIEPSAGTIQFRQHGGEWLHVTTLRKRELRQFWTEIQIIFQDPYSSLNPRKRVLDVIGEGLKAHNVVRGSALKERVAELLTMVGLRPEHMLRYPHAFSGGQRQRIGIARALALNPRFIVCDEAVSALDVSVQAQILNLLRDLQQRVGLTYLFIAHDLSVVEHISDRVAVMYVGKIVEIADTRTLYRKPLHPYTEALLSSVPRPDPLMEPNPIVLRGEVASPANAPSGCYFHPRCRFAEEICGRKTPELRELTSGHFVSCHRAEEIDLQGVMPGRTIDTNENVADSAPASNIV